MAMSARDDKEELALRKRTLDSLPSAVITVDSDGIVVCVNRTAEEMVPTIGPGVKLRASLEELTNVEKVDRILFHREIATFAAPAGTELHWMLWDASEPEGIRADGLGHRLERSDQRTPRRIHDGRLA